MPAYDDLPIRYEWDENKRTETLREREIDFDSMNDFDWETAIHQRSDRDGETRWASFGLIGNRLYHVVWTERDNCIRIISLRKANVKEIASYVETVA